MKKYLLIFGTILFCPLLKGQKIDFSSNKKPLIDTTVRSKGLLGGKLSKVN
jgi:hypothetical protein